MSLSIPFPTGYPAPSASSQLCSYLVAVLLALPCIHDHLSPCSSTPPCRLLQPSWLPSCPLSEECYLFSGVTSFIGSFGHLDQSGMSPALPVSEAFKTTHCMTSLGCIARLSLVSNSLCFFSQTGAGTGPLLHLQTETL